MFSDLLESLHSMKEEERRTAIILGLNLCAVAIEDVASKISVEESEDAIGLSMEKRRHMTEFANELTFRLYAISESDVRGLRSEMESWAF